MAPPSLSPIAGPSPTLPYPTPASPFSSVSSSFASLSPSKSQPPSPTPSSLSTSTLTASSARIHATLTRSREMLVRAQAEVEAERRRSGELSAEVARLRGELEEERRRERERVREMEERRVAQEAAAHDAERSRAREAEAVQRVDELSQQLKELKTDRAWLEEHGRQELDGERRQREEERREWEAQRASWEEQRTERAQVWEREREVWKEKEKDWQEQVERTRAETEQKADSEWALRWRELKAKKEAQWKEERDADIAALEERGREQLQRLKAQYEEQLAHLRGDLHGKARELDDVQQRWKSEDAARAAVIDRLEQQQQQLQAQTQAVQAHGEAERAGLQSQLARERTAHAALLERVHHQQGRVEALLAQLPAMAGAVEPELQRALQRLQDQLDFVTRRHRLLAERVVKLSTSDRSPPVSSTTSSPAFPAAHDAHTGNVNARRWDISPDSPSAVVFSVDRRPANVQPSPPRPHEPMQSMRGSLSRPRESSTPPMRVACDAVHHRPSPALFASHPVESDEGLQRNPASASPVVSSPSPTPPRSTVDDARTASIHWHSHAHMRGPSIDEDADADVDDSEAAIEDEDRRSHQEVGHLHGAHLQSQHSDRSSAAPLNASVSSSSSRAGSGRSSPHRELSGELRVHIRRRRPSHSGDASSRGSIHEERPWAVTPSTTYPTAAHDAQRALRSSPHRFSGSALPPPPAAEGPSSSPALPSVHRSGGALPVELQETVRKLKQRFVHDQRRLGAQGEVIQRLHDELRALRSGSGAGRDLRVTDGESRGKRASVNRPSTARSELEEVAALSAALSQRSLLSRLDDLMLEVDAKLASR